MPELLPIYYEHHYRVGDWRPMRDEIACWRVCDVGQDGALALALDAFNTSRLGNERRLVAFYPLERSPSFVVIKRANASRVTSLGVPHVEMISPGWHPFGGYAGTRPAG